MDDWIILSLLAAISFTIVNLSTKQVANNPKLNEYSIAWLRTIAALPVLWIILFSQGIPVIDSKFWLLLFIMVPLDVIGALAYFKAFKISPISLITPITSLNILFTAIGGYFILGENLSLVDGIALLLFVAGIYVLNLDLKVSRNIFYPFLKLRQEKGVQLVILFCLILGINLPIQKIAIGLSSPQFFAAFFFSLTAMPLTFLFLTRGKARARDILVSSKSILIMGVFNALYLFTNIKALNIGKVALVMVIISLNVLMTIILSGAFFKEKELLKRFAAGAVMLIGAALIALNQ